MKSLFGLAALALVIVGYVQAPAQADMASWAEAQARAQLASQMVADNMSRMQ